MVKLYIYIYAYIVNSMVCMLMYNSCNHKVLNGGMWNVGGEDGEGVRWVSAALALSYILVRYPYDPLSKIDPQIFLVG